MINQLQARLTPYQERCANHPLYQAITTPEHLRCFMEYHVFAVWDFMSLLKTLQTQMTNTTTPWFPKGDPKVRHLINEIVLAEETDINLEGLRQSHFEMYLEAMNESGASTEAIDNFLKHIIHGTDIFLVIAVSEIPECVKNFLRFTFELITEGQPHKIAAAFTFGREDLIPDMFSAIIGNIQKNFPNEDLTKFKYYFDRHIELDGDEHGPLALQMIKSLCGNDSKKWQEAEETAIEALRMRNSLWNGIYEEIAPVVTR
ncbi:MAG: DUF3050 domain-containing protein [Leeuwenhoekiella sp.]